MALLRAAPLPAEPAPCWLPTHVQVTAVRARGLTGPGGSAPAAGPGDVYAVLELGRQRQRTAVAERSGGSAEWRDGCALELPPGPGSPPVLTVTVLQRALLGADRFLGRCSLALPCPAPPGRAAELGWHKLHSKAGKKEKERGEVEVSVQFTRTNLTASMFDLSVKDKPRSPFGKLKDKVKGKKKYDLESASAIIPSSVGALDGEDDFDVGGKKSKIKGFLKGKLRKSSLTQSNTSLGSDSTISSASLGPAASAAEVTKSPSRHSSLSTELRDFLPSPRLTHKRAFSDDVSQVSPVLEPKAIQSLKPKSDPVSRSSLCINGSHVYGDEPALQSPVPAPRSSAPLPVPSGPRRPEEGFGFAPLHPEPPEAPWGGFERTQEKRAEETRKEEKKPKGGFFHHGGAKSDAGGRGQGEKTGGSPAAGDERSRAGGWFASKEPKESPQKPSPHPVKPISAAVQEAPGEKKQQQHKSGLTAALSNGLEKLKTVTTGSIQPVAPSSQPEKADSKKLKDPAVLDQSAKYYHLTHDELIQLLLQKEKELSKKEEHIQELENYIDQLLVRIMEQSPTLLQIPLGEAKTK
uniref:RAB11 family interacting protein 5 n=1 Tax=Anser cygnoides TaxID=8845 RepID=A0A8B9EMG9_ANSCY